MANSLKDPTLMRSEALINGKWCSAEEDARYPVFNPANGEVVAEVAKCASRQTQHAIEAAQQAWYKWRELSAKERANYLYALYQQVIANKDDLALILTMEQGKPLAEARGEVEYGANYLLWFAEEAKRVYGDVIPGPNPNKRVVCIKQSVGVVACISPWNFPIAMLARKIAPALAAGCTVVCKPANETPLSAFALGELSLRAGIPAGVINILCGFTEQIGETLIASPVVRKLSFTGSTPVGKKLSAASASTMKRVSMELGGNAPFIVFADANLEAAVEGALLSKFRNAGQTCVCTNRILVDNKIIADFTQRLFRGMQQLRVGDGLKDTTDIGPLIHPQAAANIQSLIHDATRLGATARSIDIDPSLSKTFVAPTLLTGVKKGMRVSEEEIFGPIAPVMGFDTEAEAIALANDTPFGLAAYLYSENNSRIWRVAEALEYGMVGINDGAISNEMAPFGGVKESGQGREGSKYGLDDYLEIKYLSFGNIQA
ncbi:MAG: NAD-dependent succinate-semialdehyde dehydrogenase [Cellvibrionaceae bacterium]|nr:NAD-dependent succinate-semialdehyde dehydrogenase [Cellvibrionaceae bacterium]